MPIADHAAAYEDEAEGLRAYHRALLGGSPDEHAGALPACSPITYVDAVQAPLLILAGENDPRCPIGQIETTSRRSPARPGPRGVPLRRGHGSLVVAERIAQMAAQLDFARRHLRR